MEDIIRVLKKKETILIKLSSRSLIMEIFLGHHIKRDLFRSVRI